MQNLTRIHSGFVVWISVHAYLVETQQIHLFLDFWGNEDNCKLFPSFYKRMNCFISNRVKKQNSWPVKRNFLHIKVKEVNVHQPKCSLSFALKHPVSHRYTSSTITPPHVVCWHNCLFRVASGCWMHGRPQTLPLCLYFNLSEYLDDRIINGCLNKHSSLSCRHVF